MRIVKLNFWGYTWELFRGQIEYQKGILLVYRGIKDPEGYAIMTELLYVRFGQVCDLYDSSVIHSIRKSMAPEEMLYFSLAEVDQEVAEEAVSLLVDTANPVFNDRAKVKSDLVIECSGKCDFLPPIINN